MNRMYCCKPPSKYKSVTHVIFDLDGTILDTEGMYFDALTDIVGKYDKPFTPELGQKVAGAREADVANIIVTDLELPMTPDEFIKKYREVSNAKVANCDFMPDTESMQIDALTEIVSKYDKPFTPDLGQKVAGVREVDIANIVITDLELTITPDEFIKKYREARNAKVVNCDFKPGAEALIRHLQSNNIPIAIATSSTQESYDLKTKKYKEVFDLFHHIVCAGSDSEVKEGKPSPDTYLVCASRFSENPDPSQCLVLEDAPNGLKAGLDAGMQVVMVPNENVPYEIWKTATLRLDSLELMPPEFFGLPPLVGPIIEGYTDLRPSFFTLKDIPKEELEGEDNEAPTDDNAEAGTAENAPDAAEGDSEAPKEDSA